MAAAAAAPRAGAASSQGGPGHSAEPRPADAPGRERERERLAEELWADGVAEYVAGRAQGRGGEGLPRLLASLEADPRSPRRHYFVGCVASAFHRDHEEAARRYEAAIAADPGFGYAYLDLCQLHDARGDFDAAREVARRAVAAGARWQDEWQRPPAWTPGLTARPWWDRQHFPWAADLEARWEAIRDEALALPGGAAGAAAGCSGMPPDWPRVGSHSAAAAGDGAIVAPGGEWRERVLYGFGVERAETVRACPATAALLEELLPGAVAMATVGAGEVLFSALAPGTRLAPHCASSNMRLTCHLGLVCPAGARIRVGPEWGEWQEGKCTFFDDSFIHEVVNDSDSVRIVLLIRFWHPELPVEEWKPTLQRGAEEFESLQRLRLSPAMTPLAEARLREALNGQAGAPREGTAAPSQ